VVGDSEKIGVGTVCVRFKAVPVIDIPVCQHIDQKPANKRRTECHSEISWAVEFRKGRLWLEHRNMKISACVLINVTDMLSLARFLGFR
jgi:hypothetical protein